MQKNINNIKGEGRVTTTDWPILKGKRAG